MFVKALSDLFKYLFGLFSSNQTKVAHTKANPAPKSQGPSAKPAKIGPVPGKNIIVSEKRKEDHDVHLHQQSQRQRIRLR